MSQDVASPVVESPAAGQPAAPVAEAPAAEQTSAPKGTKKAAKKSAKAPATKKATKKADTPKVVGLPEAVAGEAIYTIPIGRIVSNDNPRHEPENLYQQGYKLVDPADLEHSLLHMALSDDMEQVKKYIDLIEQFESAPEVDENKPRVSPQSIVELSRDLKLYGQLVPVHARSDKKGDYTLIDGSRRTASILYLHAKSKVDGDKKVFPATISVMDRQCNDNEAFILAVMINLSRKSFTVLQEAAVYREFTKRINPETGKKYTITDVSKITGVAYGTVRNREALLRPYKEAEVVKGKVVKPASGLSDKDREKLQAGEMTPTNAMRKALGEKHFNAETAGAPVLSKRRVLPIKEIERLYDETPEVNTERRNAFAEVMGLTPAKAERESQKRIQAADAADLRKQGRSGKKRRKVA